MKDINMNYLNSEQKQKLEKIVNLQNSIEASKEKQEERISMYDDYLNNKTNKVEEELKIKKMIQLKKQRDKKKKLEKKMNDWIHKQEKISEKQKIKNINDKTYGEEGRENEEKDENEDEEGENDNGYNEKFDISKYNVISLDNMKNEENNNDEEKKKEKSNNNSNNSSSEIICMICQRKFASAEKLALHEKLSELHKQNLNKLKLNNN